MSEKNRSTDDAPTELTGTQARQGTRGRPVLVILIAAMALAGAAALILHPYKQGSGTIDNAPPPGQSQERQPSNG